MSTHSVGTQSPKLPEAKEDTRARASSVGGAVKKDFGYISDFWDPRKYKGLPLRDDGTPFPPSDISRVAEGKSEGKSDRVFKKNITNRDRTVSS